MQLISTSPTETQQFAKEVLRKLKNTSIICLYGQLGSGKTTFVQGLAKALGIKKRVISPSFVLVREYEIPSYQLLATNYQLLIHIDCYRLKTEKDIKSVDLPEIWEDRENLVIIEWAERIAKILPKARIDIKFEYKGNNKHRILIVCHPEAER